jgi:DnaJ-class molecular chaperone
MTGEALDVDTQPLNERTCPQCRGGGYDRKDPEVYCGRCDGYGTLLIEEDLAAAPAGSDVTIEHVAAHHHRLA